MPPEIVAIDHVNVVVSKTLEDAAKNFYGSILGLQETPKPMELRARGGAWYQVGAVQLHLSVREQVEPRTQGHVCVCVSDVASAEERLKSAGVEIIPDELPIPGQPRFYVRDPGGNLIEVAQEKLNPKAPSGKVES